MLSHQTANQKQMRVMKMKTISVALIKTQSGKIGLEVFKRVHASGVATFSYDGKFNAGSGNCDQARIAIACAKYRYSRAKVIYDLISFNK